MKAKTAKLPADLAAARGRFEKWRAGGRPRRPLPEKLWQLAIDLVPAHGVYRVSKALRLEYYKVKERAEVRRSKRRTVAPRAFVEVVPSPVSARPTSSDCTVELTDASGRRMTIRSPAGVDTAGLVGAFFGARQ